MFQWIKRRSSQRHVAHQLYGSIVSQARHQEFYRTFGVADSVEGRFELICLHLFGVLERLAGANATETVGRDLVERFFTDMDDVMREMGVGDSTVPKKMRTASEALYGRLDAYGRAVRSDEPELLVEALTRNVFGDATEVLENFAPARALAGYTRTMIAHLDDLNTETVVSSGTITFPSLEA
jgi:cytochrome b pre-mRNA-processing protein 3